MFTRTQVDTKAIDQTIATLHSKLETDVDDAENYSSITDQLIKLYAARSAMLPAPASADTRLLVMGNLLGIAIIVGYEQFHPMTSKALGLLKIR